MSGPRTPEETEDPDDGVVRWRTGLARTVRGPRSLQLGVGPGAAVLDGLAAADWDLLGLLERGPRRRDLLAVAARRGLPAERARLLLRLLLDCGAAVPGQPVASGSTRAPLLPRRPSLAGADVAVVGGGGLGVALAVAVAAAGAGGSSLVDDGTVTDLDVLPGGAQVADVGRRATHVAAEAVHRFRPHVRTACPTAPDLVLLVSAHVADAPAGVPLVQAGTTHLPVVVHEEQVVVGPLVVPGHGACLHCLDLHHRDLDPGWPQAVLQLRRGSRRVPTPAAAVVAVVTGLATLLAGAPDGPARAGVGVSVGTDGATSWHRWAPHPVCGCVGWPETDSPGPDDVT